MIGGNKLVRVLFMAICLASSAPAIYAQDMTACGVITGDDAQKFVGGPLDVKEQAKVPVSNAPGAYNSVCTYIARGEAVEKALTAPRLLDLTLHVLDSAESMAAIYENTVIQYTHAINSPEMPFKNATIDYLGGFGDKAFVLEAVADPKTGYKSALIVFYKGRIGGSIAAWKKPEASWKLARRFCNSFSAGCRDAIVPGSIPLGSIDEA